MGLDDRGRRLEGRLDLCRKAGNGRSVVPGGWKGFSYETLRVESIPPKLPADGGTGHSGENAEEVMGDSSIIELSNDEVSLCADPSPSGGVDEAVVSGGSLGGTVDPVVVIDLEAEVAVEEVDSDGEGIAASAWNRTNFVRKGEDVPVGETNGRAPRWECVVTQRRLRTVLRVELCARLLVRLGLGVVAEDADYAALLTVMARVQNIYDDSPGRNRELKRLARELLDRVHATTHVKFPYDEDDDVSRPQSPLSPTNDYGDE